MDAKGRDPLDYSLLAARDPLAVLAAEQQRWSVHVQLIERVADGLPVNVDPADAAARYVFQARAYAADREHHSLTITAA